ncbi:MAG: ankyrin repeat domain-containing protein, partial [Aquincola sp.]|nr:ankyrin repeat domain-containing protein [Aquincola sp.]
MNAVKPPLDEAILNELRQVFHAARQGDVDHLAPLLRAGLPADLTNDAGDSLLMLAAYHRHAPLVALLLAHGADPERRNDKGQSPLGAAAFKGDEAIVALLLQHGAPVDATGADG